MAYQFTGYLIAKSYLESLGFTLGAPYLNTLTTLRNTSRRAELFYAGSNVGYIETPTDLLPDENWVVNIPYENRAIVPEGVLSSVFGDTGGNEGWENRQFYIETDHFTRFRFGNELQHVVEARGPGSTINLKTNTDALLLYKEPNAGTYSAVLDINMSRLAQLMRYEFADIMSGVATPRPAPRDFDLTGAFEGYLISIDGTGHCRWMSQEELGLGGVVAEAVNAQQLGGVDASQYLTKNALLDTVGNMVIDNIESGIQVTYNNGKLNFNVNDFNIVLTGAVSGSVRVTNLSDVLLHTTLESAAHSHDNRYPLLVGNSQITGTLGATALAAETGTNNGLRLRTDLALESTTRGVVQLHWDNANTCNEMWMGVLAATDRTRLYGGARLTLEAVDLYETVSNIKQAYTSKQETGTSRTSTVTTDTLNITTFDLNGVNVSLDASTLLSLGGANVQLIPTGNISMEASMLNVDMDSTINIRGLGVSVNSGAGVLALSGDSFSAVFDSNVELSSANANTVVGGENVILRGVASVAFDTPFLSLPEYVEAIDGTTMNLHFTNMYLSGDLDLSGAVLNAQYTGLTTLKGSSLALTSTATTAYVTAETVAQLRGKTQTRLVSDVEVVVGAPTVGMAGDTLVRMYSNAEVKLQSEAIVNIIAATNLTQNAQNCTLQIGDDLVFNAHDLYANITDTCQVSSSIMSVSGSTSLSLTSPAVGVHGNTVFYNNVEIQGTLTIVGGTFEVTPEMDARYVNVDGDTMMGPLSLNYVPSSALHAINKQYLEDTYYSKVQSNAAYYQKDDVYSKTEADTEFLSKTQGGTMLGSLILAGAPTADLEAATKKYVDDKIPLHKKNFTIGDGVSTYFDLEHNLNTYNLFVEIYEATGDMWTVDASWKRVNANTIRVYFDPADTPTAGQYIVSIFG